MHALLLIGDYHIRALISLLEQTPKPRNTQSLPAERPPSLPTCIVELCRIQKPGAVPGNGLRLRL